LQVTVEADVEHPFFVYNRGWSSASPARTLARYGLNCRQLRVGDDCVSLTHADLMAAAEREAVSAGRQVEDEETHSTAAGGTTATVRVKQENQEDEGDDQYEERVLPRPPASRSPSHQAPPRKAICLSPPLSPAPAAGQTQSKQQTSAAAVAASSTDPSVKESNITKSS
jgi:hypothetical protein